MTAKRYRFKQNSKCLLTRAAWFGQKFILWFSVSHWSLYIKRSQNC